MNVAALLTDVPGAEVVEEVVVIKVLEGDVVDEVDGTSVLDVLGVGVGVGVVSTGVVVLEVVGGGGGAVVVSEVVGGGSTTVGVLTGVLVEVIVML